MRTPSDRIPTALAVSTAMLTGMAVSCGDGSEMGLSTNRGSGSQTEDTSVENAFIVPAFLPGRCAIQLDTGAELRFTVDNASPTESERLTNVSTDVARTVETLSVDIPAQSTVGFGQVSGSTVDNGASVSAVELGPLDPAVEPGMSTNVTFHFDRAGELTIPVPVEACPRQQRDSP